MAENNKKNRKKPKKKRSLLKAIIILLLFLILIGGTVVGAMVYSIVKEAPDIDPTEINASLDQTSSIYDEEGNLLEKIDAAEYRTFVSLTKMPEHLKDAFIAIEDERFYDHKGIDVKGILGSVVENIKAGRIVRGASTITQQLVKNVYLTPDKKLDRKIKEAYLAIKVENVLSKNQILEAYLNRNFFGQNAYGVQEAAQTYFAKDVEELTIAESAVLAGVVKNINRFQPYKRVLPNDFNEDEQFQVGEVNIHGVKYILVFNEEAVNRQKLVLKKMKDLGSITEAEYEEALKQDIKTSLQPGQKKLSGITSYFSDFVKTESIKLLQENLDLTREQAEEKLFTGGLKIYSTIDVQMQKDLEEVYNNFTEILVGNTGNVRGPILIDWRINKEGNIIDDNGKTIFYKSENILDENWNMYIENGTYRFTDDGHLAINNKKLTAYPKHIDIADFYRIDGRKNLVTHTIGSIALDPEDFSVNDAGEILIHKSFLDANEGFYAVNDKSQLVINSKNFFIDINGAVQPQSASVIMDYRNGHIKAVVGGRELDGNRILNRATNSLRQPGSVIKPVSVYLPALDNGYTAASAIDDIPLVYNGQVWPNNWYKGYRGIQSLRYSVEQSINVNSVQTVQSIGFGTSMEYLARMGIINKEHPELDNFVSAKENPQANDENPSALALGGMSKGLTPLEMTAAYGAIANDGVYIAPTPIIKILDKDGDLLIENTPKETVVVSPQVAYIMKDILHTTVTNGLAKQAQISNMAVAGKTGTTQNQADIWFVGFTPYYVSSVWIGNDSPAITLNRSSGTAALLWKQINQGAHKNLEAKTSFPRPEGIVSVTVCSQSGLLPSENCSHDPRGTIKTEIFAKGTEPTSTCDVHVAVDIDETTGKVANEFCPQDRVVTRVFIQRKKSFDSSLGLAPSDIGYQVPGACTEHSQDSPGFIEEPDDNENPEIDPDNPNSEKPNNGNGSTENEKPTKPENGNGNGNNGNGNNGSNNKDDDFETIPIDPNA